MSGPVPGYSCRDEQRSEAVRDATTLNGIDYVEVLEGQTKLEVHFLHPLPGQPDEVPVGGTKLNKNRVVVEGGDRVRGIEVLETSTTNEVLTVTLSDPGDFSTYTLRLVDPVTKSTPTGYDPRLSAVGFTFKTGCPIRFDCAPRDDCPPEQDLSDVRNYLAKDYDSFRQLLLDRLTTTIPDWKERNPADLEIALVELLAFVADRLSYEQDAVATEAYLGTARQRVSVRRHARMLGYRMHEGAAARAFVFVDVDNDLFLDRGRQFLTGPADDPETLVFESLHALQARKDNTRLELYTWTDEQCCLPRGSTRATLIGTPVLAPGEFLLFEETVGSLSGDKRDVDRTHRHVVRLTEVTPTVDPLDGTEVTEVVWSAEDALPFPFCVSSLTTNDGVQQISVCGVARGNVVLVEHGRSVTGKTLSDDVDVAGRLLPRLPDGRPTYALAYDDDATASQLLEVDPREAMPIVKVTDGDQDYHPRLDLLGSPPSAAEFVVETQEDGTTWLRFGDDTYAQRREPAKLAASYRIGHGEKGNVGPESITVLVGESAAVRNPLPARGGTNPESLEKVRTDAPHAFREQDRAVTEADYGTIVTDRFGGVQRAAGRMRWTGSWYTAFVTVDRAGGLEVDPKFSSKLRGFLDGYRMAGIDVEVSRPSPVPVELDLEVCAQQDRFATDVERDILEVLSSQVLRDGRRGLFHPDNFTFGTPVYLSRVYAAVLAVPGVKTARATRFRRYGEADRGELSAGVLRVQDLEVAQLANDPDVPERGVLTVTVGGGR